MHDGILLYKVVRFCCIKLKISINTEPIEFFVLGKLYRAWCLRVSKYVSIKQDIINSRTDVFSEMLCISLRKVLGYLVGNDGVVGKYDKPLGPYKNLEQVRFMRNSSPPSPTYLPSWQINYHILRKICKWCF